MRATVEAWQATEVDPKQVFVLGTASVMLGPRIGKANEDAIASFISLARIRPPMET